MLIAEDLGRAGHCLLSAYSLHLWWPQSTLAMVRKVGANQHKIKGLKSAPIMSLETKG
jgi:hypothetical protein